jgi:hypothetical protein
MRLAAAVQARQLDGMGAAVNPLDLTARWNRLESRRNPANCRQKSLPEKLSLRGCLSYFVQL